MATDALTPLQRIELTYAMVPYAHARLLAAKRPVGGSGLRRDVNAVRRILQTSRALGGRTDIQAIITGPVTRLLRDLIVEMKRLSAEQVSPDFEARLDQWLEDDSTKNSRVERLKKSVWELLEVYFLNEPDADALLCYRSLVARAASFWPRYSGFDATPDSLQREISFPPEHQQAGIGILSYFSVILQQKLPDVQASVSIQQQADRVTLTIKYTDGSEEQITQLLSDYGLVVRGSLAIDALLPDPLQALALRNKLQMAELELRQSRELLALEKRYADQRFAGLEAEVAFLRDTLAAQLAGADETRRRLLLLAESATELLQSPAARQAIPSIAEAIAKQDESSLVAQAITLRDESPDVFERVSRFLSSNAVSGVVGNAVYDWIKILWPILPK